MIDLKLKTFILISVLSFILFALSIKFSSILDNPMSEEAITGKMVWQKHNCVSCHTLLGNGGYVGRDLTHVLETRSPDYLMDYFMNPPVIPPNRKETHPPLSKIETAFLTAYFEYIRTIPTLGWPPKPKEREGGDIL